MPSRRNPLAGDALAFWTPHQKSPASGLLHCKDRKAEQDFGPIKTLRQIGCLRPYPAPFTTAPRTHQCRSTRGTQTPPLIGATPKSIHTFSWKRNVDFVLHIYPLCSVKVTNTCSAQSPSRRPTYRDAGGPVRRWHGAGTHRPAQIASCLGATPGAGRVEGGTGGWPPRCPRLEPVDAHLRSMAALPFPRGVFQRLRILSIITFNKNKFLFSLDGAACCSRHCLSH